MSLQSWKKEFYPVSASRVADKDALAHSLRKWQGLTRAALRKHKLVRCGDSIGEKEPDEYFPIDSSTCALCEAFHEELPGEAIRSCGSCPLVGLSEQEEGGSGCTKEYLAWSDNHRLAPMLALLRKAMRAQAKKDKA